MSRNAILAAALGLSTVLGSGAALAADPAACQAVRFSDVGWTDITATTATASVVLLVLRLPSRKKSPLHLSVTGRAVACV